MRRYIIFGCGVTGKVALQSIDKDAVECFADNFHAGEIVCGKHVISFREMLEIYEKDVQITIVVAADNYWKELETQLQSENIKRYFVFHEYMRPIYMKNKERVFPAYSDILKNYHIKNYQKIAIYGSGLEIHVPLLIDEIKKQNPTAEIVVILQSANVEGWDDIPCPVVSWESVQDWMDCLVINVARHKDPAAIREDLETVPYAVADLYAAEQFEPAFHYAGLERFKNIHAGKRVFVIGNGPSLTVQDLNTLHEHGEICIAFNKVYRVYDRTAWRADYLGFSDMYAIEDCEADIPSLPGQLILADSFHFYPNKCFSNVQYYHMNAEKFYPNYPGFSDNASKVMYNGWTVTYDIGIQLATYMGCKKIYLLGVDHSMNGRAGRPENHFIADYTRPKEAEKYQNVYFEAEKMTRAFEKAELYSRKHGFRIFNATRGGKLEVFERVDFDSLFAK